MTTPKQLIIEEILDALVTCFCYTMAYFVDTWIMVQLTDFGDQVVLLFGLLAFFYWSAELLLGGLLGYLAACYFSKDGMPIFTCCAVFFFGISDQTRGIMVDGPVDGLIKEPHRACARLLRNGVFLYMLYFPMLTISCIATGAFVLCMTCICIVCRFWYLFSVGRLLRNTYALWAQRIPQQQHRSISRSTSKMNDNEAPRRGLEGSLYTYRPISSTRSIRLLRIHRKTYKAGIQCSLLHVDLDDKLPYEAISYTWGDSTSKLPISIDGFVFYTTSNVFEILQNRSSYLVTKTLWIDSVCINQDNKEERSQQVQLMRDIYQSAKRVIVWLGNDPQAHLAHHLIAEINNLSSSDLSDSALLKRYAPEIRERSGRWLAMIELLCHPWFNRVWVVQEAVVASNIHVLFGNQWLAWDALQMLPLFICYNTLIYSAVLESINSSGTAADEIQDLTIERLLDIERERDVFKKGGQRSFGQILSNNAFARATDSRDLIFALLGLTTDVIEPELLPDYTKNVGEVFMYAARHMLQKDSTPTYVLYIAGVGLTSRLRQLPSWVPDWTQLPDETFGQMVTAAELLKDTDQRQGDLFQAAGTTKFCLDLGDANTITLKGLKVDKIRELSSPFLEGVNKLSWFAEAHALAAEYAKSPYFNALSLDDVVWRTMTSNSEYPSTDDWIQNKRFGRTRPASVVLSRMLPFCLDCFSQIESVITSEEDAARIAAQLQQKHFGDKDEVTVRNLFTRWHRATMTSMRHRRLCVTEKGYIGLVPSGTIHSDLVCIIFGAQTPFILRTLQEESLGQRQEYSFVGECYIHGMMDGEMLGSGLEEAFILR